jgi:ubiquinone/menaquinone biosynthesis C-methylase UbiE
MSRTKIDPFEKFAQEYDAWFEDNRFVYESELRAVQEQLPRKGEGVEVGVGSGRFAAPLGIRLGIDPSQKMRERAQSKGIIAIDGVAENLPFADSRFDYVLMVTTICFLDDIESSLKEAHRVLKPGGSLIVGFIDRDSPVGKLYQQHKNESNFYHIANFYTAGEVESYLKKTDFRNLKFRQTIFQSLERIKKIEPIKKGYGEGSFVVVKALKPKPKG